VLRIHFKIAKIKEIMLKIKKCGGFAAPPLLRRRQNRRREQIKKAHRS